MCRPIRERAVAAGIWLGEGGLPRVAITGQQSYLRRRKRNDRNKREAPSRVEKEGMEKQKRGN